MKKRRTQERPSVSLWQRCLAFAADYLLIALYLLLLIGMGVLMNYSMPSVANILFGEPLIAQLTGFCLITLPVILYFAVLEASPWQASWGKRRLHLKVVTQEGARLKLGHSLLRTSLKFVPWELAHTLIWRISFAEDQTSLLWTVGFIFVWLIVGTNLVSIHVNTKHQALYDRIAGTVVVVDD